MSNCSMSVFERKLKTASCQFINKFPNQKPGFEVSFAAGLPHFAAGWTRCWGRDTFTSNELLLLYPKVYKQVIIQFASALRHGMIPNLLDGGNNPRYNCRDACWWFIRGVK
jgi:glycogen debranching enzyme